MPLLILPITIHPPSEVSIALLTVIALIPSKAFTGFFITSVTSTCLNLSTNVSLLLLVFVNCMSFSKLILSEVPSK